MTTRVVKADTSVVIPFGPFVDLADGVTLETGLVSALDNVTTGIRISKNGGAYAARNATVTATTYDSMGMYLVTLDTTDTNTEGHLHLIFEEAATCLPVWANLQVVNANVYDSLFAAATTDYLDINAFQWAGGAIPAQTITGVPEVDVTHFGGTIAPTPATAGIPDVDVAAVNGVTAAAVNLALSAGVMVAGTVDNTAFTATNTILESDDITEATADHYNDRIMIFTSGILLNQQVLITDYAINGGRGRFTYSALASSEVPGDNDTFIIV